MNETPEITIMRSFTERCAWIARFDEENGKRVLNTFGACVARLHYPISFYLPLNPRRALVQSRHENYLTAIGIEDYFEIELRHDPGHLSTCCALPPRLCEVLLPLANRHPQARAFELVDIPVLRMEPKELQNISLSKQTAPFRIRVWT